MSLENFTKHILPIKHKLYRFSLRIVGNTPEAEDVVQEVFIKMWKRRAEWDQYRNIEAWCMQLTKNLSIDKLRSKHQKVRALADGMDFVAPNASPDRQAELSDAVGRVRQLMQNLPEKQRQVMELRDLDGQSYQEIADFLDISLNQVKVYLHRARKTIKKQLINHDDYGL